MVLFPIAFIWVAAVLVWIIWKGSVEKPESPPSEPRRWRPRGPRRGPSHTDSRRRAKAPR